MFGFSGTAYGNLNILIFIVGSVFVFLIVKISKRRGINVTTHKFGLTVFMFFALIILIPLWFTDLLIKDKIIGTTLALAVGISNYLFIDRIQRKRWKELEKKNPKKTNDVSKS